MCDDRNPDRGGEPPSPRPRRRPRKGERCTCQASDRIDRVRTPPGTTIERRQGPRGRRVPGSSGHDGRLLGGPSPLADRSGRRAGGQRGHPECPAQSGRGRRPPEAGHRRRPAQLRNHRVVDRGGRVLGVRVENGVNPAITSDPNKLVFAVNGALAEARTGAFFASDQAPLTSRTVQSLSQSTVTRREVQSNPSITDPNSTTRGPGYVAPVGIKGHFPPGVPFTPAGQPLPDRGDQPRQHPPHRSPTA